MRSCWGLNWVLIHQTTLVVKGLSVKLIQSAPILLTFELVHKGAVFDRSALINPRSEGRRILKKIIREDRRKSIQTRSVGCRDRHRWPWVGNKTSGLNDSLDNYMWPIISDWSCKNTKTEADRNINALQRIENIMNMQEDLEVALPSLGYSLSSGSRRMPTEGSLFWGWTEQQEAQTALSIAAQMPLLQHVSYDWKLCVKKL